MGLGAEKIGLIAGLITLLGFVPYCWAIVKGRTKPNQATWVIWTVVGVLLASSYWASGARNTLWVPLSYLIGPVVTMFLAIRYGERKWSRFDRNCLIGAGFSLLLWILFRSPQGALVINMAIDLLGVLPLARSAWHHPENEDRLGWVLFSLGNSINILAIERFDWEIAIYPFYLTAMNWLILGILLWRRQKVGR
jgi:hypothetical protein